MVRLRLNDEIEQLRKRLEQTEEAVVRRQAVMCELRKADVLSPQEAELSDLIEARDTLRALLSALLARRPHKCRTI